MKGVLIDKGRKHGTFLTGKGEFVKGKHKNRDIGEEFVIERSSIDMKKAALVIVLVIALVGGYIPYNSMTSAYGYVELNVNPSVQLGYNGNLKVTQVTAMNPEGEELLEGIEERLKGEQLEYVIGVLLAALGEDYDQENIVALYTSSDKEGVDEKVAGLLTDLEGRGDIFTTLDPVDVEEYEEISEMSEEDGEDIPPAVYVLKDKIAALDSELLKLKGNSESGQVEGLSVEELIEKYEITEDTRVSELAHIKNMIKKEIQEEKRLDKEKQKNQNSQGVENQEEEDQDKGKDKGKENAPGQNREKNEGDENDAGLESLDDNNGVESEGGDESEGDDEKVRGNSGKGKGNQGTGTGE